MNAATTIATAIAVTRRKTVRRCEQEGATAVDRAIAYAPESRMDRRVFQQFVDGEILRSDPSGRGFWLDRAAWAASRRKLRGRILAASGLALALVGLVAALGR
jgi:hypothetical protein